MLTLYILCGSRDIHFKDSSSAEVEFEHEFRRRQVYSREGRFDS